MSLQLYIVTCNLKTTQQVVVEILSVNQINQPKASIRQEITGPWQVSQVSSQFQYGSNATSGCGDIEHKPINLSEAGTSLKHELDYWNFYLSDPGGEWASQVNFRHCTRRGSHWKGQSNHSNGTLKLTPELQIDNWKPVDCTFAFLFLIGMTFQWNFIQMSNSS